MYQGNLFCVTHAYASHAAALAGGAAQAGRGCFLSLVLTGSAISAELPSGMKADLHEVLVDQVGAETYIRFRFIAPAIDRSQDGALAYGDIEADFPHLCTTLALPYLTEYALNADKIVISVADRAVEFGTSDPDATQYFEQFRAENGDCIWEHF